MRIVVFIAGMILAMVIVGTVSVIADAPWWVTVLRVIGTAFVAQVLYLVAIALMSRAAAAKVEPQKDRPVGFPSGKETEAR